MGKFDDFLKEMMAGEAIPSGGGDSLDMDDFFARGDSRRPVGIGKSKKKKKLKKKRRTRKRRGGATFLHHNNDDGGVVDGGGDGGE